MDFCSFSLICHLMIYENRFSLMTSVVDTTVCCVCMFTGLCTKYEHKAVYIEKHERHGRLFSISK